MTVSPTARAARQVARGAGSSGTGGRRGRAGLRAGFEPGQRRLQLGEPQVVLLLGLPELGLQATHRPLSMCMCMLGAHICRRASAVYVVKGFRQPYYIRTISPHDFLPHDFFPPRVLPMMLAPAMASSLHNGLARQPPVLYVSAAAAAGGDGSPGKPFASLGRAQAAVRKLLASAAGSGDVTVSIAGGAYFNTSLALTEADSPSPGGGQVSWQAAAGATVAVYGGARITGWTRSLNMRPGIWQATLPKELVDAEGRARFGTLVQDERSAWLARTPNFGSGYLPCGGSDSSFSCAAGVLPVGFDCQLSPGASGANNATSACSVFMRAGYSSDLRAVTGIVTNPTTQAVSVAFYHPGSGSRGDFYIQGALEFLDQEGEWAVHRGTLYYWPYSAHGMPLSPESLTITAPVAQRVFSFVGSSHAKRTRGITLSGLRIIGSSMPQTYIFMCRGNGPGASPHGASCGPGGGPDSVDETNTSPSGASEGMVYMENGTHTVTCPHCNMPHTIESPR